MRVLTIDKDDWSKRRFYELDSGFVFHFGNAWEDAQGVIRLSYMRADDDAPFRKQFDLMRGYYQHVPGARMSLMRIDPGSGRATEQHLPEEAEFPSIDARHVGRQYRHIVTLARTASLMRPGYDMVQRRDLESDKLDRYQYGPDVMPEEHILIPDLSRNTEGSGWVIGSALDLKRKITMLSVFDAMALHDGPLAQARLPYAMPLGLHGVFQRQG
jgi:carotenoid cleavage dioxygenase